AGPHAPKLHLEVLVRALLSFFPKPRALQAVSQIPVSLYTTSGYGISHRKLQAVIPSVAADEWPVLPVFEVVVLLPSQGGTRYKSRRKHEHSAPLQKQIADL